VPIRIYALAKDLKIDSKELVDFCNKAGIPGKGSALASLEDDEIAKLKTWMDASATKRQPSGPAPLVDTKAVLSSPVAATATLPPPPPPRTGPTRPRVTPPTISVAPAAPPAPPAEKLPEVSPPVISAKSAATEPQVRETPPAAHPAGPPAPHTTLAPSRSSSPAAPMAAPPGEPAPVRGDSLFSRRGGIKVLDAKTKRPAADGRKKEADAGAKPMERRAPSARFAAMPEVKQPSPSGKGTVERVQKPILKLPTDVLKGKTGTGRAAPLQALADKVERERKQKDSEGKLGVLAEGRAGGPLTAKGKKKGRGEEEDLRGKGLADMASVRAERSKGRKPKTDGEDDVVITRRKRTLTRSKSHGSTAAPRKGKVAIELPCTVRTFSEETGVGSGQVLKALMGVGMMGNINAVIPDEYVELIASELGLEIEFKSAATLEEKLLARFNGQEDDPDKLRRALRS
jgi:translation initiation factor IF-2